MVFVGLGRQGMMSDNDDAMRHLGKLLHMLCDLTPGDRCRALDEAQAFYNAVYADRPIVPSGFGYTTLRHVTPMFDDDYNDALRP